MSNEILIFVVSHGRPIYLWNCLDALFRHTQTPARVVLADNWHPDREVDRVIAGFEKRGLVHELHRFDTNSVQNIATVYENALKSAGPFHVFLESDACIVPIAGKCWLSEMKRIFESRPEIGMLGSAIDTTDFVVRSATELACTEHKQTEEIQFLAKLNSPERAFLDDDSWFKPTRDFFYTEPPCPLSNPPGRLLMLSTPVVQEAGWLPDAKLAEQFRLRGMRPAISPKIRHRHLSLLNIFDYPESSASERNAFFRSLALHNQTLQSQRS